MFNKLNKKDVVFVDIEANDKPARILQFGAIKLKKDGVIEYRNWFSNPKCKISARILKMVEKNLENIENGMSSIRIIDKIEKFLKNSVLISYGPFDYSFLNSMSQKLLKRKLNVTHIDLQNEWKKVSMSKNVWSLEKLALFFNVKIDKEKLHDAFYDTETLYKIFEAWNSKDKEAIMKNIYRNIALDEKCVKLSQNKENCEAVTINNIVHTPDVCLMNINITQCNYLDIPKKLISNFDILEISNNQIKRNWSFFYDVNSKDFDLDDYVCELSNALKQYIICIRHKKIIINESDYQKLIKLNNECSKYLDVFPLNKISFTTGFNYLFNKIDFSNERFMKNLHLIKNWKVYQYLMSQEEK